MNFVVAAHLDPFELAASLRTRMGLFEIQADRPGNLIEVRRLKGERYTQPAHVSKWPELTNMLQRIKRLGDQMGGIEFGRIDLELLPAGACMDWRRDRGEYAEQHEHAVMMLRTNPGVVWFAGAEVFAPQIGFLTIVSRQVSRSAINMGDGPAIWLAIDSRRKEPLQ